MSSIETYFLVCFQIKLIGINKASYNMRYKYFKEAVEKVNKGLKSWQKVKEK
jgi:hypothetical protein